MSRLQDIDGASWQDLARSPAAVLLLGKSDCSKCAEWATELSTYLDNGSEWENVRFGKILLDKPGTGAFKKANPWLAELEDLPYTVLYRDGERVKGFLGGGIHRLVRRMERAFPTPGPS